MSVAETVKNELKVGDVVSLKAETVLWTVIGFSDDKVVVARTYEDVVLKERFPKDVLRQLDSAAVRYINYSHGRQDGQVVHYKTTSDSDSRHDDKKWCNYTAMRDSKTAG